MTRDRLDRRHRRGTRTVRLPKLTKPSSASASRSHSTSSSAPAQTDPPSDVFRFAAARPFFAASPSDSSDESTKNTADVSRPAAAVVRDRGCTAFSSGVAQAFVVGFSHASSSSSTAARDTLVSDASGLRSPGAFFFGPLPYTLRPGAAPSHD